MEIILSDLADGSVSLYFGLHEGQKADLEVISKAAIEWVNSIRLATNLIAPDVEVRVEFVNAHESSLSINSTLKWLESAAEAVESKIKYPKLTKYAVALAVFLAIDAGPTADFWLGGPDTIELNEADRQLFEELLEKMSESPEIKATNRRFFKILTHDPAVSSVGICEASGQDLAFSVPSEQFAERTGLWDQEDEPDVRTSERVSDVILDRPNLSERDLAWTFTDVATGLPFTAKMRDDYFAKSILEGGVNENLRQGIEMQIHISFKEKFSDGEWRPIKGTIQVLRVTPTL
ncbi:hypothetical protein [Sulfitobacter mediterraneus]|uniref:hypothetical protein n=1 Tax=Sulfitobacter mediterraneus TaxID=83219 RepID=UPI001939FF58|nr:hypothetical protein [Sulfitobacter mediterraneus]MBM1569963.1 hypothetical protein [Sulfitobacter mediterraneus]MBM1577749.1 hypothetical protein [Sulfitobacter mediterraneus]MBM1589276.1 hypothetical protein [Sulfitobacter mediterraneus]MBM1596750.1 hypothetical protein [Sulfitobacter mediterraneus]MBM1604432.1 hypothetical protein [Sulfitobacter mediterraneus]